MCTSGKRYTSGERYTSDVLCNIICVFFFFLILYYAEKIHYNFILIVFLHISTSGYPNEAIQIRGLNIYVFKVRVVILLSQLEKSSPTSHVIQLPKKGFGPNGKRLG